MQCHAVLGAGLLVTALAVASCTQTSPPSPTTAPASTVDWNAVGQALGKPLETGDDGVHGADFPRTDLHVSTEGVSLSPGMELGAEANFLPIGGPNALVIGEMTATATEEQAVIDQLARGGVEITAIHKHLPPQTPDLWWIHFASYGDAVGTARALHAALGATATPLAPRQEEAEGPAPSGLDVAKLDQNLGVHGEIEDGVYHAHVPVPTPVTDTRANVRLPDEMEASTLIMFQSLGVNRAAINGDFAVTGDRLSRVLATLRQHDIQVLTVHNHMINEQPRLFYTHFWAIGDALTLAQGLRAALDQTR